MPLAETLKILRGRILSRAITNKAEFRQGVVLALLHELGWPVFDTNVVRPSHNINGDSVDFGLFGNQGKLVAVIIVDAPSALDIDGVDASLYVTEPDEPLVIHTNGLTWRFMLSLPPKGVSCDKAFTVPTDGSLSAQRFESFLRRENLDAGHARETLAGLLARKPADSAALMATWLSLIGSENLSLHTLLADEAEERFGSRPSVEEVAAFFQMQDRKLPTLDVLDAPAVSYKPLRANLIQKAEFQLPNVPTNRAEIQALIRQAKEQGYLTLDDINEALPDSVESQKEIDNILAALVNHQIKIFESEQVEEFNASQISANFEHLRQTENALADPEQELANHPTGYWYRVGEARFTARSAKDVVLGMLRYLENQSPGLLEKVTKHPGNVGNSRRYIAHSPAQLYPKRPDYAADDGKYALIIAGLYLMTNSSTKRKKRIITLVTTVAGLTQGRDFDYALDR